MITRIEKMIHGIKDSTEKSRPMVPKVDGMIIKRPDINPTVEVDFE